MKLNNQKKTDPPKIDYSQKIVSPDIWKTKGFTNLSSYLLSKPTFNEIPYVQDPLENASFLHTLKSNKNFIFNQPETIDSNPQLAELMKKAYSYPYKNFVTFVDTTTNKMQWQPILNSDEHERLLQQKKLISRRNGGKLKKKSCKKEDGGTMNDVKYKLEMPIMPKMRKENLEMPKYQKGGILNFNLDNILNIWKK